MHSRIDIELFSKITYVLEVLAGAKEWNRMSSEFFQRPREDGPWRCELGNSHVQPIDHRRTFFSDRKRAKRVAET